MGRRRQRSAAAAGVEAVARGGAETVARGGAETVARGGSAGEGAGQRERERAAAGMVEVRHRRRGKHRQGGGQAVAKKRGWVESKRRRRGADAGEEERTGWSARPTVCSGEGLGVDDGVQALIHVLIQLTMWIVG
uniref:Uncharacterized protein n=1 Tax=Oryza barthii TaxID=65489 RepID=A0A0D3H409_9ORYZ